MTTVTVSSSFRILGMSCGHCQHAVTEALAPPPGIISVAVDLVSGTATVESRNLLDLLDPDFEVAL
jgi:copper chaperone CopZ